MSVEEFNQGIRLLLMLICWWAAGLTATAITVKVCKSLQ